MKIEYVGLGELVCYPNNSKKHSDSQVNLVAKSIASYGFKNPILVDKDNVIIAGHCRFLAANKLDLKEIPIIRVDDLSPAQVMAFRIMDNKSAESEWDEGMLKEEFESLKSLDYDLDLTGFESFETKDLFKDEDYYTPEVTNKYTITLSFDSQDQQKELFTKLSQDGYKPKLKTKQIIK